MTPFLLIGLGNPGASYAKNRHNIGFMAIDRLAKDNSFPSFAKKFGGESSEGRIAGQKAYLFKPLGYMNTSGVPSGEIAHFYKIPLEHVVVIHDELDLPLGRMRVKRGGGHGGHNGLKSLDAHLGQDYWRVRLGIGHPGDKERVTGHVLSDFGKEEWPMVEQILSELSRHIGLLLSGDAPAFMSKVSQAMHEE